MEWEMQKPSEEERGNLIRITAKRNHNESARQCALPYLGYKTQRLT